MSCCKTISNLSKAAVQAPSIFSWFRDGISGIIKCLGQRQIYTDEDIASNRHICRECPYSTRTNGKLTLQSQCMAPDPNNNNAPCGCFITCKTMVGECPLKSWIAKKTDLTINSQPMNFSNTADPEL